MTALTLGTAGHVDHGKTALVGALTGIDTDRLPEEKARGISIALGFASLRLPSGATVSLVDVPGHERFVRHMVAGASGIDGYLLCVAADDGVMPQTVEHMSVLRLLGVEDGVVAITKADLLDPELAIADTRELVGTEPEIVAVSVVTGQGLSELAAALDRLAGRLSRRTATGASRLFVDRVFSVTGAGTVVTGTLWGGPVAVGERVRILPGGIPARVRGIEMHDREAGVAEGGRTALNLAGIEREDAPRGSCVVRADDDWHASALLDVALTWTADAGGHLRTRRRLQAFLGTAEVGATCVLLDADELAPGAGGYAQLRLDSPVPAAAGDRIVLRSAERRTVGGARVIDPRPARHGRGSRAAARLRALERGDPVELLRLRVQEAGAAGIDVAGLPADDLQAAGIVALPGGRGVTADAYRRARDAVTVRLGAGPLTGAEAREATGAGPLADAILDALAADGVIARAGGGVARPGEAAPNPHAAAVHEILRGAGLRPPGLVELSELTGLTAPAVGAALATLRRDGAVVAAGELWFDAQIAADAADRAVAALAGGPMGIGALRDLWGVGRRHALALAAHLDATGLTRRVGDERVLRRGAR